MALPAVCPGRAGGTSRPSAGGGLPRRIAAAAKSSLRIWGLGSALALGGCGDNEVSLALTLRHRHEPSKKAMEALVGHSTKGGGGGWAITK